MEFPRCVYKRGTAKPVIGGGPGEFVAEYCVARSSEELEALGSGWVATPTEAAEPLAPIVDDREEKPTPKKKAK